MKYFKISNLLVYFSILSSQLLGNLTSPDASVLPLYHHIFNSAIFADYQTQIQKFAQLQEASFSPELSKSCQDDKILALLKLLQAGGSNKKVFHEESIRQLRLAMQEAPVSSTAVECLDHLATWMYTEPKLFSAVESFFQEHMLEQRRFSSLTEGVAFTYAAMQRNPSLVGYQKDKNGKHDLHFFGNLPFVAYSLNGTRFIYMGRVTLDENRPNSTISVAPEFTRYLSSLSKSNKRHLYINLMQRATGEKPSKQERNLSLAIENLEKEYPSIAIVTLDKNSSFYWQSGSFAHLSSAHAFKKAFREKLEDCSSEALFHWPHQIDQKKWRAIRQTLLDNVHSRYFNNQSTLSSLERQAFIEICYLEMILALCAELKPHFANITCKNSVDRGPSLLSLLYAYQRYQQKGILNPREIEQTLTLLLAPSFINKNRPCHQKRVERFTKTWCIIEK